jgi:hypothetical protein
MPKDGSRISAHLPAREERCVPLNDVYREQGDNFFHDISTSPVRHAAIFYTNRLRAPIYRPVD